MPLQPTPTLTGDSLTISRFLASPTAIRRELRDFRSLRFVSDQILTKRFRSTGGAATVELTDSIITDRTVEGVAPGSEYPYANVPTGTVALAAIVKWGQKIKVTDEEIARNLYGGDAIKDGLRKVVTSIIKQVDIVTMSAVGSALTDIATAGIWDHATPATRQPLADILLAIQAVEDRAQGYTPDTLVVSPKAYTYLMLNDAIANLRKREVSDNPVYTGMIEDIAGLSVIKTPNLPVATSAYVLDSKALGGMLEEVDGAPGYSVAEMGIEILGTRRPESDSWDLQGRRKTVPIVQETGAGQEITGVVGA